MQFTYVLLTGTLPSEESSSYLHSEAQGLPGSSCNQEGKMNLFAVVVVASSKARSLGAFHEFFSSALVSAPASRKTTIGNRL